jgi:phosphohistidine phosphatase
MGAPDAQMDLILWRHAEAQESEPDGEDTARPLTPKGERQAVRMAAWLDRNLPESTRILASPAVRAQQTVRTLQRKFRTREALGPMCGADDLIKLVQWPEARGPVLVVGHQPTLGQVAAQLLGIPGQELVIRKGAIWWLRHRSREQGAQTLVITVQSPDTL